MVAKAKSVALYGLEGILVEVETDIVNGQERFDIVGLPDAAVKEAKERVRSAVKNSAISFPFTSITVNLAPADVKKEGAYLDLPIAVTIIKSVNKKLERDIANTIFVGELSLEGYLRPVQGILPITLFAKKEGFKRIVLPVDNAREASLVGGIEVLPAKDLKTVAQFLGGEDITPYPFTPYEGSKQTEYANDLKFVKGQYAVKRALEIAVSGGHNLLMVGAPGSGKTMIAKCIPSIIPDMTFEEALQTTAIHSVYGTLDRKVGVVDKRPFVTPHHTATNIALVGGGQNCKPGLISLAHNGVLYLDEMPEYTRQTLECLRQPLEDGVITVSRAKGNVRYPADFMLVASMNPCPCGNLGSEVRECKCTDTQIRKYRAKISGPLLDRIDIQVQVDNVEYDELTKKGEEESSSAVRARVNRARLIQRERFAGESITCNAQMSEKHLLKYCALSEENERLFRKSFDALGLSARGRSRILKVARTIADLDLSENIERKHLLEAISYRSFAMEE